MLTRNIEYNIIILAMITEYLDPNSDIMIRK